MLCVSGYAQDSTQTPGLLIRPFVENGIDFIRNDQIKENYRTQSKYFFGIGVVFGHPETEKVMPYLQVSRSSFAIETTTALNAVLYDHSAIHRRTDVPVKEV